MKAMLRSAIVLLAVFSGITGLLYPLVVWGVAAGLFPTRAAGSLLEEHGVIRGSELIGQSFSGPGWFWSRPSATAVPYDGAASAGPNLGPLHPALAARVAAQVARVREPGAGPVPVDLVTASASGLDPHLSPAAARYQIPRVARERGLPAAVVSRLVDAHVEGRQWGVFGEPRVNVLRLNLALADVAAGSPNPGAEP